MESQRQQKISRLLQRDLSTIFQDMARKSTFRGILTVTKVLITKDLSQAKVYISIFGVEDKQAVLKELKGKATEVRFLLGKLIRHQLRVTPELLLFLDDSLDYIENIERALGDDN